MAAWMTALADGADGRKPLAGTGQHLVGTGRNQHRLFKWSQNFATIGSHPVPIARLFLLKKDPAAPADSLLHSLAEFLQQPRQGHFKAHIILADLGVSGSYLAQRPHAKIHAVAGPELFLDLQHRKAFRGLAQRRLCTALPPCRACARW
jgi:hypothetical protein